MIAEILILKDGICVFHRAYGEMIIENVNLTGGFFEAILLFSSQLNEGMLKSITMGESIFHFAVKRGFTFVIREKRDLIDSDEPIDDILDQFARQFHKQFPDAAQWDSVASHFANFNVTADQIIKKRPSRQGFPILLDVLLKPFFTAPVTQLVPVSQENQNSLLELQYQLRKYAEEIELKKLELLLEKPFVLYLPKSQKIVYLFPLHLESQEPIYLLCFLTNHRFWFAFYQLMPLIHQKTNLIIPTIMKHINILEKLTPEKIEDQKDQIEEIVSNWADLNQYVGGLQISLLEELFKAGVTSEALSEEQARIQFDNLATKLGDDIDKVVFALLSQRQIIFVGENKEEVEQTISALLAFYPHPSVTLWSKYPEDHLLVGTHPYVLPHYDRESALVVDLETNQVHEGEKNTFCAELMEETKQIAQQSSIYDAKLSFLTKVSSLFELIKSLLIIFASKDEEQQRDIQDILEKFPKPVSHLIARMSENLNVIVSQKVQKFLDVSTNLE
ncbi:MAG: hypothetical protein ACFFBD_02695 [Candidatus Hodarchaeota archaeon]